MSVQTLQQRQCHVESCSAQVAKRGFCNAHYIRFRRAGIIKPLEYPSYCTFAGCKAGYYGKGYCKRHYFSIVYRKPYYQKNKRIFIERQKRPKEKLRMQAHGAVFFALKKGRLTKGLCESCKSNENIVAHHDSYLKQDWLKVRWFCRLCHAAWHKEHKAIYPKCLNRA